MSHPLGGGTPLLFFTRLRKAKDAMVFVPIPNTARVELRFTQDGQQLANVFHVRAPAPLTVEDLETIATVFVDWYDSFRTVVCNAVTLREIDLRDLTTASGIGILYNTGLPLVGTIASPALPNNVTVAVKWGTGLTGRSFRGRTFHIGLSEGQVVNSAVDSAFAPPILSGYNALPPLIKAQNYLLVVASRYTNNAPRPVGVTTEILTAAYADTTIDSQRKRLPGRGR